MISSAAGETCFATTVASPRLRFAVCDDAM